MHQSRNDTLNAVQLLSGNGEYNLWVGILGRPPRDSAIRWAGAVTQSPVAVRYGVVWLGGAQ